MTGMLQDCRAALHQCRAPWVNWRPRCPYTVAHAPSSILAAMLTEIALVLVLALCNGFFACRRWRWWPRARAASSRWRATAATPPLALRHAEAPEHFLSTVQVGITLVMLVTGAVAGDALGGHIAATAAGRAPGLAAAICARPRHRARLRADLVHPDRDRRTGAQAAGAGGAGKGRQLRGDPDAGAVATDRAVRVAAERVQQPAAAPAAGQPAAAAAWSPRRRSACWWPRAPNRACSTRTSTTWSIACCAWATARWTA